MKVVYDLHAGAHRAWHAASGDPLDALARLELDLEAAQATGELSVSVDAGDSRAGRRALMAEYKAKRPKPSAALGAFLAETPFVARQYTDDVWGSPGWEADDVTLTLVDSDPISEWVVWHCHTDELQLISRSVTGRWHAAGKETVDVAWTRRRFGCSPSDIPLLQAIAGDASDGIEGVPGFGPVKAARAVLAGWTSSVPEAYHDIVRRNLALTQLRIVPLTRVAVE